MHADFPASYDQAKFSLIRGGPFYRAQQATRLIGPDRWNMFRRIVVVIAITWLPLVLITLVSNIHALPSLLCDYRVYARLFLAVPALLLGQALMESRFQTVVGHFTDANLLDALNVARTHDIIRGLMGLKEVLKILFEAIK
jgi:hypothetical protein